MIALPKLSLALLLGVVSKAMADAKSSHIRYVTAEQEERALHHTDHKDWKKLEADIRHQHDYLGDVGGSILIAYDGDDKFDVSYHLHDLPGFCDTCFIAIMDEDKCSDDLDKDDHHYDDRRLYHKYGDDGMDDPFTLDDTGIISDYSGDAVGGFIGVENGYTQNRNRCKIAVVWAEVEEEASGKSAKSKSPKSPKSYRRERNLVSSGDKQARRRTHYTKKVMRVVGCGVLKKQGDHDDCE